MTSSKLNSESVLKLEIDELLHDLTWLQQEAALAFYKWEESTYGVDSPISDEGRILWMQGYVYAYKQLKGLIK